MRYRVMTSLSGRGLLATWVLVGVLIGLSLTTACTSTSPAQPGSAGNTPLPSVSIVSLSVASETLVSGARLYRVIVKLRESGGVAATIASIDLSFMNGSSAIISSHADRPISDAANVLAPNSTMDSRELTTTDEDPSHPHATSVTAKVNYSNGASTMSSADAAADVPLSRAPTFTLSGLVSEENSGGRAVAGAIIQVVDGPNAGKSSSTDGNGSYSLTDLAAGSFSIRATANGYNAAERAVTVAEDTRLDLRLLRTTVSPAPAPSPPSSPSPSACAYTVAPSTNSMNFRGGSFTAAISRTAGSCSWQASSDASWITFPGGTSGNSSATLSYSVVINASVFGTPSRNGSITISWAGGSAQLRVFQGGSDPEACNWTVTKGPEDFDNVPSAGGQVTGTLTIQDTINPRCRVLGTPTVPWISGSIGVGKFTLTVAPNPSPGTARSGAVEFISEAGGSARLTVTQR
jgi:hypothetical protein